MKISVIQPDIAWEDKLLNIKNLTNLIKPLFNNTDVVLLPEMFNTGFSMNTSALWEAPDGVTYSWMLNLAQEGDFAICGSYIIKEDGRFYNRFVFVTPEQQSYHYDKRHLFRMGAEDKFFSPGNSRLIFSFRGMKISPYICYDLRFPVWSRNTAGIDLIIYAANWPESRQNVWNTLLKARAIENQCYVAGSNRTGTDGTGIKYSGESMIVSPRGEIIVSAGEKANHVITSGLSLKDLSDFREKFPVANDADDFTINT